MKASGWAGLVVAGALSLAVVGCQKKAEQTAVPATPDALEMIRQQIKATNPNAFVGQVVATLPDGKFAAVGDVPVAEFREGEVISFIDVSKRPLAHGVVRAIGPDTLHVEIEQVEPGGRAPQVGDIAYRFKI